MKQLRLDDFSAGLWEKTSPEDFTERQVARAKGFVLPSEVEFRTQGPFQKVGLRANYPERVPTGTVVTPEHETELTAQWSFRGDSRAYIIALSAFGDLMWAQAPSRTASYTASRAVSFVSFEAPFNPDFRCTGTVRWNVAGEFVQALIFHSLAGSAAAVVVYENATSDGLTYTTVSNFRPKIERYEKLPDDPNTTAVDPVYDWRALGGRLPRHNVSAQWKDFLVLGDIEWSAAAVAAAKTDTEISTALDTAALKRYSNYLWFSDPGAPDKYGLLPVRAAEEGSTIVGLQVVEEGLLVLCTTTNGQTGVTLLRGDPSIPGLFPAQVPEITYRYEQLFPGTGLLPNIDSGSHSAHHTFWAPLQSCIFIDSLGNVQQVRSMRMGRIDVRGPASPGVGTARDEVCAMSDWLFAARSGRLYLMRNFGADGSWTQLVPPSGTISSMSAIEDCLYFVAAGQLWRYCTEGPVVSERGLIDGLPAELTFSSRTLGDPENANLEKFWDAVTVRLSGQGGAAKLRSVRVEAGGALLSPPADGHLTSLEVPLSGRKTVTVNGHGPSPECSVTVVVEGDVTLETVVLHWEPGQEVF